MADPSKYQRDYSFTDFQSNNPSSPLPGSQVDNELENVEASLGETIDALADIRRSDGALKNGIVTLDTLSSDVQALLGESDYLQIVSDNISQIVAVSDDLSGNKYIETVAVDLTGANTTGTVAGNLTGTDTIGTVAADLTGDDHIGTVAGEIANVVTVADVTSEISQLAGLLPDVLDAGIGPYRFVADLIADTTLSYAPAPGKIVVTVGQTLNAQGFRYEVAASDATDHHVETAGGVKLYVLPEPLGFHVDAFGADPTGAQSSSAAVQKAQNAAYALAIQKQLPGSNAYTATGPRVVFSGEAEYLIDTPIDATGNRILFFYSSGKTLIVGGGTMENNFVNSGDVSNAGVTRYVHVSGFHFQNFDEVFSINSANADLSMWVFERCNVERVNCFLNSHTYALSRSTHVTLDNMIFQYGVVQIARAFVDKLSFRNCWLGSSNVSTDLIYANSLVTIDNSVFVPPGNSNIGRSVVRLTNDNGAGGVTTDPTRGVVINGCRASNEGGQGPLVVNEYPLVNINTTQTPFISITNSNLSAYHPTHYEDGNSETGIVYLKAWPAFVNFSGCGIGFVGDARALLVAKSDSLTDAAPNGFGIEVDDATYRAAQWTMGANNAYTLAKSLRGFIRNPDPYTFRGLLEDGHLLVEATGTSGQKKASFRIKNGYGDVTNATPIVFMLFLAGQSTTSNGDLNYSGGSVYLVSINGFFSGTPQVEITYTKLHGSSYGVSKVANADIVSMHFGTGDTGSATVARDANGEYEVTVVFGTSIALGRARIQPGFYKPSRYGQYLSG